MTPSYNIDPSNYSLLQMKRDLVARELIPSRKPLLKDLDQNFKKLLAAGISNLAELISVLKDKKKIPELSSSMGIEEEYLILVRREANSYLAKPVPLSKFAGAPPESLEKLADIGIKNSRQLFERGFSRDDLISLLHQTGLPLSALEHLRALSDLVRAYGVGPVFAELLYQAGIQSLQDFGAYKPEEIVELYQEKTGGEADFSISDLKFSLDLVRIMEIS